MSLRHLFVTSVVGWLVALLGVSAFAAPPVATGYAVPIGGALRADNDAVWQRLVDLAGGPGARFVVFGTASSEPAASAQDAVRNLQRRGAVAEALPVSPLLEGTDAATAARDPALVAKVQAARGAFFTGGSQDRIVDTLLPEGRPTPLLEALRDLHRRGGVVAGTSAGAAIMSVDMFRDAPNLLEVLKGRAQAGREYGRGLGFAGPGLFVDQHFLRRGRIGRLIPVMQATGYRFGLGVDENTAAFIHGDEIEVVGASGAVLVDLREATSDAAMGAFNVRGARLHYLDHGDRYDRATQVITPSAAKRAGQLLDPAAPDYDPSFANAPFYADILADTLLRSAMAALVDGRSPEVQGLAFDPRVPAAEPLSDLGFLFRLYKGTGTRGWYTDASGNDEYTVTNLLLDITPVRMAQPLHMPWKR